MALLSQRSSGAHAEHAVRSACECNSPANKTVSKEIWLPTGCCAKLAKELLPGDNGGERGGTREGLRAGRAGGSVSVRRKEGGLRGEGRWGFEGTGKGAPPRGGRGEAGV